MKTTICMLLSAILVLLPIQRSYAVEAARISPFQLPDLEQTMVRVAPDVDSARLTVVCFLGAECPLAKLYAHRLNALNQKFAAVRFVGINSNRQDSLEDLKRYADQQRITFPLLKDFRNEIADRLDASRTPEVVLLDESFQIRYRGRIDDQYLPGLTRAKPTRHDLTIAIEELLAGEEVSESQTQPAGCLIGRVRTPVDSSDITYCKQVSRILYRHCVECHREGEIGPFQLEDYEEVVGWADTIIEVIDDGRMPPWHASPDHGRFINSRNMPPTDKQILRDWVAAGMPYGSAENLPIVPKRDHTWRLPSPPDLIIPMNERSFAVPAEGTVEYQYFVADPKFNEDKWITGAQIVPGNSAVVHHSIVFVRPPDGARFRGIGWLAAYVPGSREGTFPTGCAVHVPVGSKLVFQQHYTPNGSEQSDLTKIALTFGEEDEITHEIYTLIGIDQEFEIPPHASHHVVQSRVPHLPSKAQLLSITPHMHLRGKSFRLRSVADEDRTILLDVPRYDFNWQHTYRLETHLDLSEIDELEFDIAFDNSGGNPVNPNPNEHVTWGDQTWEEMAVAFFEVKEPRSIDRVDADRRMHHKKTALDNSPNTAEKAKAEADRILGKFDANRDGVVTQFETPLAFRRFAFREIDLDRDGKLTRSEIEATGRRRANR